jgi:PKD repeat protein
MDTTFKEVVVYPPPDADFIYSPASPDPGDVVYFTDQSYCADSNDYIIEWRWYFGDGDSSIVYYPDNPDVTHIYADTGMYMATLTVFDNDTCMGSITQGVNINSTLQLPPLADFIIDFTCLNMYTFFTDLSIPNGGTPIVSWAWDFGDGGTSTLQNPQYLYGSSGNYDITLIVTNSDNLSDTMIQSLYAYPLPDVSMQAVPSFGSVYDTIQFYGSSGSSIASWFWNFDDGTNSSLQNPMHIYQYDGLFDVSLTVTDTAGCIKTEYIVVRIYPELTFPGDSTAWNTVGDNSISGDEWRFRYGMIGDTIIGLTDDTSYTYTKVYSLYDSTLSTQYSTYFGAIRTEGDQVYALLPGYVEALLYDYTLEEGDTIWYPIGGALCYDGVEFWEENHYRVVTNIDSVEMANGEFRRRWQLQGGMNDTWIQGIGSVVWYGLFNPFISTASYCGDTYTFACMKEGDEVVYLNNPHCDHCFCDLLTYIKQPQQADSYIVNVYPNPFSDHALIEFRLDQPAAMHVQLIDASGIMVNEIPLKNYQPGQQQLRLNTNDLGAGIYVLKVTFNGTDIYTAKLIRGY